MNNILITGVTGSGGSYLAEHLSLKNIKVHGTTRWHSTTQMSNIVEIADKVTLHECDLTDLASVIRVIREVRPVKIFHMAAMANVRKSFDTPIAVYQNNTTSTLNLFEAIRLTNTKPTVVICSSSEVYGNPLTYPMKETHPIRPVNPYAASKHAQETIAHAYFKSWDIPIVITRAFTYINPRRRDLFSSSFARQVAEIEAGQREVLTHGNLDSIRSLVDVRDICEAYWLAAEKGEPGEAYNIGGDFVISVGEFITLLQSMSTTPFNIKSDQNLMRPVDVTKQIPDVTKFKAVTGWEAKYQVKDSIQDLLNFYRREVNIET